MPSRQCEACEYAGCIWIVVVIVVPMFAAMTDSSSTDKTLIFIIQMDGYEIFKFHRYLTLTITIINDSENIRAMLVVYHVTELESHYSIIAISLK